jgi:hypothetical protein
MTMTPEQQAALEQEIEREIRAKATTRAYSKLGFMWHFAVFAMVNLALVAINLKYSPDTIWFVWPLGAWGAGVFLHAFATFMMGGMTDDMLEQEIEREKRRRGLID